jgi:hypothetical protein
MTANAEKIERIKARLREVGRDGRVTCAAAEAVAAEFGVSRQEVGRLINELELKIYACQLGCF